MSLLPRPLTDEDLSTIDALVGSLTIAQKASLTAGRDMWSTTAIPSAGIPSWRMTDGPNGARGNTLGPAGVRALCMPSGSALAATWDVELVREVGRALGQEARARGARVLLGPTVNIQRSPLAGRTFECFSEDPCLAAAMTAAYVDGVQSQGVVTTVKHLAGNEAEFERHCINSIIEERSLREIYLVPFEAAVKQGGALGMMTAYNRLNGTFCADNAWLLSDVLRGEWGFEGIVVTDWWALADTKNAANAGLDIEMPGEGRAFGATLGAAVQRGEVDQHKVDAAVTRLLRTMTSMDAMHDEATPRERDNDCSDAVKLARRAATDAFVLIRNEGAALPLDPGSVRRVAVIGPNARSAQIMGGGSATLRAHHLTPPLAALQSVFAAAGAEVVYQRGCPRSDDFALIEAIEMTTPAGEPGIEVSFYNGAVPAGEPVAVHVGDLTDLTFMGSPADGVDPHDFSVRAVATYVASTSGLHRFRFSTNARARIETGPAEAVALGWREGNPTCNALTADFDHILQAGEELPILIEFAGNSAASFCQTALTCLPPAPKAEIEDAARIAAMADVAIVIVGTGTAIESEGFDRLALGLPGRQDELIRQVAAANRKTIVVVNSGSPVALPWMNDVAAVLQCWFGGQEMAPALAAVITGAEEPGGRTPITFPIRIEHSPAYGNFPGEAGEVRYGEGIFVGYRWYEARHLPTAVPFGHGLSYTRFAWNAVLAAKSLEAGQGTTLLVGVTNVGDRPGSDVVQVYVSPPPSAITRCRKELRGFAKVRLAPGESRRIEIDLGPRAFAYWHPGDVETMAIEEKLRETPFAAPSPPTRRRRGWTIEAGTYEIHLARSSAEIVATLPLEVTGSVEGWQG